MDVVLADESGAPRPYKLVVQPRSGGLGVMLQGSGGRYMLSDAVSAIDLASDEFVGRASSRAAARRRALTRRRRATSWSQTF